MVEERHNRNSVQCKYIKHKYRWLCVVATNLNHKSRALAINLLLKYKQASPFAQLLMEMVYITLVNQMQIELAMDHHQQIMVHCAIGAFAIGRVCAHKNKSKNKKQTNKNNGKKEKQLELIDLRDVNVAT